MLENYLFHGMFVAGGNKAKYRIKGGRGKIFLGDWRKGVVESVDKTWALANSLILRRVT